MKLKPKNEALAYRIWAYCTPKGWDCLVADVAEALGENMNVVRAICAKKGWNERMRGVTEHEIDRPNKLCSWDDDMLNVI